MTIQDRLNKLRETYSPPRYFPFTEKSLEGPEPAPPGKADKNPPSPRRIADILTEIDTLSRCQCADCKREHQGNKLLRECAEYFARWPQLNPPLLEKLRRYWKNYNIGD